MPDELLINIVILHQDNNFYVRSLTFIFVDLTFFFFDNYYFSSH